MHVLETTNVALDTAAARLMRLNTRATPLYAAMFTTLYKSSTAVELFLYENRRTLRKSCSASFGLTSGCARYNCESDSLIAKVWIDRV